MAQTLNLDITPGSIPPIVNCSQCDVNREIDLEIFDGTHSTFVIPEGAVVTIMGTKDDGHSFVYNSSDNSSIISFKGNEVTIFTSEQMTAYAGNVICELKITDNDTVLHTVNFTIVVEESALPTDPELSDSDIPIIVKAVEAGEKIDKLDDKLKEASEVVSKVEELVADTKENAAKATQSATNAATSEANAKTSETDAAKSATEAASSETNAKTSETNAASSASEAEKQATSAIGSATAASTSEANAKASETAAASSELNAKNSEVNTATSEKNAKTSETNAASSASAAATSASNAKTSEANAKTSETNAASSATAASQSATEAKTSAENNEKWAKYSESYAKGGTTTRTDEDSDNSKYYSDLSKQFAAQAQAAVTGVSFYIVDELPSTGLDGVFYLIAHSHGSTDSYDEYVWLKDQKKFERIGTTDVDLTDYIKRSDVATTVQNGAMSSTDKAKLDNVADGATKTVVDDELSATSTNPVTSKAIVNGGAAILNALGTGIAISDSDYVVLTGPKNSAKRDTLGDIWSWFKSKLEDVMGITKATFDAKAEKSDLDTLTTTVGTKASQTDLNTANSKISSLESTVATKADASTVSSLQSTVNNKADSSTVSSLQSTVSSLQSTVNSKADQSAMNTVLGELYARPNTRKLGSQYLSASGGTLSWTDSSINDNSYIDVYATLPNIAPSNMWQSGNTVYVTFDAQSAAFNVGIVVM